MGKRKREKEGTEPVGKRELPARGTRGNRMNSLLQKQANEFEQEEGDQEFWNQQFFADEERDEVYKTESEKADSFASDFLDTEEDTDDDAAGGEDEDRRTRQKRKVKTPSYRKRRPVSKKKKAAAAATGDGEETPAAKRPKPTRQVTTGGFTAPVAYEAPSLRNSTRQRVEEARTEREKAEQAKKQRRRTAPTEFKLLTQEELLAEAAQTEIENTKSLQQLVALEEETKRKADVQRDRAAGPSLRYLSKRRGDGVVTVLATLHANELPPDLCARVAPPAPRPQTCVVTGQLARYRDPASGLPYATAEAFRELRRRLATNPHQAALQRSATPVYG